MKRLFGLLVLLPAYVCAGRAAEEAAAAPNATNMVALEGLVADVLERNPELKFYSAEIAAAKGERRTAGTRPNPEVSSEIGRKTVRGGGLSDEGIAWSVSVQQPFEWPGRMPLRKAIANQQVKLAELGFAQFKAALAAKARTLAYTLFRGATKSGGGA
jgi:outer membrane protein, heavy metal efflux system